MPDIHLNQTRFTYSACGPFNKHKEIVPIFLETGDSRHIYKCLCLCIFINMI